VAGAGGKPLDWHPGARRAFLETLERILLEDPRAAELVRVRVDHALALVQAHPSLGTPTPRRSERRYAIPTTGHVLHYRVTRHAIRIVLWYRARRQVHR
jgi:plasmid stabilization system protein ParE